MQYSYVFLGLAAATIVSAQLPDISGLPACAQTCGTSNISKTKCSFTDIKCICADKAYQAAVASCVQSSCSAADVAKALAWSKKTCGGGEESPAPEPSKPSEGGKPEHTGCPEEDGSGDDTPTYGAGPDPTGDSYPEPTGDSYPVPSSSEESSGKPTGAPPCPCAAGGDGYGSSSEEPTEEPTGYPAPASSDAYPSASESSPAEATAPCPSPADTTVTLSSTLYPVPTATRAYPPPVASSMSPEPAASGYPSTGNDTSGVPEPSAPGYESGSNKIFAMSSFGAGLLAFAMLVAF